MFGFNRNKKNTTPANRHYDYIHCDEPGCNLEAVYSLFHGSTNIGAYCDYTANAFVMSLIKVSFGSMIANACSPASRTRRRIVSSSAFSGGMNSALGFNALPVGKVPCRNHQPWVQWVHRSYICPACTIHYPIRRCSRHTRRSTINNAAYDKFFSNHSFCC